MPVGAARLFLVRLETPLEARRGGSLKRVHRVERGRCGEPLVRGSRVVREHLEAFRRFRTNRYSDRLWTDFDPLHGWPGARYIALHTLSHLLIRTIALECGYSSASLSERIYPG